MFHRRFFPGRYFAPRYFPQATGVTPAFNPPEVVFTLPQRNQNATLPRRNMNITLPRRK